MRTNLAKANFYKALSMVVYVIPMAILIGIKYWRTAGGGVAGFGYVAVIFCVVFFKDKFVSAVKNRSILTVSIVIFAIALVMKFMADELLLISAVSLGSCVLCSVFEPVIDVYMSMAYLGTGDYRKKNRSAALPDKKAWGIAYGRYADDELPKELVEEIKTNAKE